ncbi:MULTISPECIES: transporter substrate-binding domain-containing protein [Silvimonas]|uniref:transporter substrate-binding domain-containing protein n=1 Tax=Silvimonas TaxID=300264 RepID=UPI0024B37E6D|nr:MULTISPECIES: transporter substrate-binding domain-containing protein [Silvimonas]MDR3428959.1 transporter substrate-binding domain-containing protein [Silvimonas sp.]
MNLRKQLVLALALAIGSSVALAQKAAVIRIGIEAAYPPFESKSVSGKLQGFDIDIANALCKKIEAQCSWVEMPFDNLIPALQANRFDAIHSAMNITEERLKSIAFTDPIYAVPVQLIANKKSHLTPDVSSLKGKRIGVLQGSIMATYAKTRWEPKGVTVVEYSNQDKVYMDLLANNIDASLQESQAAYSGFLRTDIGSAFGYAGAPIKDASIFGPGVGIGLRKSDTALRQQLNDAIAALKADGTFDKIAKHYFQVDVIDKSTP